MNTHERTRSKAREKMADPIKSWVMVALTLIFVGLYGAALIGWLEPLSDDKMVGRLEPIIFAIIGYYFGRLPAQQNEKALKDEISRQTEKADTVQQSKEQALETKEALLEKVKNTKAALASVKPDAPETGLSSILGAENKTISEQTLRQSVVAALKVLES